MNGLWNSLAERAGSTLSTAQHELLNRYLDLLLEGNQRMNLTRITDRFAAEVQHVGDALTALPFLPQGEFKLADVGSGGGVPGIPLAIARPDAGVLLIESTKKKAAFLRGAVAELGLSNVTISDARAEEVGRSKDRESFDVAIVRAVATLPWLVEWMMPLVRPGGKMLAMKGPKVGEEIPPARKVLKMAGGGEPVIHPVDLPGTEHRAIVEIIKRASCDARLPRPATSAKGRPL